MAFNVAEFRANMIGDGARPNLFSVSLIFPTLVTNATAAGQKISFMAKTAQLPGSSIGTVPVYYFGREMKFAGNRTFADWTITVINDEDFRVRDGMERWMNAMNSHAGNVRNAQAISNGAGAGTIGGYTTDATVYQFGKTGDILRTYNFVGIFPIDMTPIDLDWGSNDSIEEFSVTFAYQYWTAASTT